jgi:hypothetical protein
MPLNHEGWKICIFVSTRNIIESENMTARAPLYAKGKFVDPLIEHTYTHHNSLKKISKAKE